VEVGRDLSRNELLGHYDAVIYAYGAALDRPLGVPGEDLPGSLAATAFVNWYNGHPDFAELDVDLSSRRAVVVGNGNVAIDVARMLAVDAAELARTDIADHAIAALAASNIEEIVVIGRRGPAQAAFTTPELRELGGLSDVDVVVDPADLELDPVSRAWVEMEAPKRVRDNVSILREYAARAPTRSRRLVLRFLYSPVAIEGDQRVRAVKLCRNELVPGDDGGVVARAVGEYRREAAGLVLRAVGYRGAPLDGVPFDPENPSHTERPRPRRDGRGRSVRGSGVRHRLDQARADRNHRDEQARCQRDRRPAVGRPGLRTRACRCERRPIEHCGGSLKPRREPGALERLEGHRQTRVRARPGTRPTAREGDVVE
jgi:NADPH-dependent glutamate synthase beta subunit-like oxidoreductase